MKKLVFITLFLTFFFYRGVAQSPYYPMVQGNNYQQWNVDVMISVGWPNSYYTEIQCIKDNITIDGVDYKIVWRKNQYESCIQGAVREEDKRVYYRKNNGQSYGNEILLYDFNLTVGDIISINEGPSPLIVLEDSETEVNGTMRRQLGLAVYWDEGIYGDIEEYWIEGIGSTYGFLYSGTEEMVGASTQLICYHEGDDLIWNNEQYSSCVHGHIPSFAPLGAEWYFNMSSFMGSPVSYYHMEVLGDTIIQDHNCQIISPAYLPTGNNGNEYIYEENNKVYWYNQTSNSFTTLYDFSAEEGESWICQIASCVFQVTVYAVDNVSWNGRIYRRQHVVSQGGEYGSDAFTGYIIEGIGYQYGLFPCSGACEGGIIYDESSPDFIRCYIENGQILYHQGDIPCDYIEIPNNDCWDGTVANSYAGGDGTPENPYQIATAEQLALLAYETNNEIGGDAYYILTNDICLNIATPKVWIHIGRHYKEQTSKPFTGFFDGNDHTIYDMFTVDYLDEDAIGLFGYTNGATIKNLVIDNSEVQNSTSYSGLVVGWAENTNIINCSVNGVSTKLNTENISYLGGLAGYLKVDTDKNDTIFIKNCINNADYYVNSTNLVETGGLVCKLEVLDGNIIIEECVNNGNNNNGYLPGNFELAGGIIGYATAYNNSVIAINDCKNNGDVKANICGGIVGEMHSGTIKRCTNNGNITGVGEGYLHVGGIAGILNVDGVISNSFNKGNIITDYCLAGGIVGFSSGNVYNVYNAGEIIVQGSGGNGYGTIVGNVQDGSYMNCYWLANELPAAGNPVMPYMPGSTSFHQGSTLTNWVLDDPQYGTTDLLEALNLGSNEECLWLEDINFTNNGLPICCDYKPTYKLIGSEWYYEILNENGNITYQYLEFANDTTINDKPIHILVRINTLYDKSQITTHEYIYEENNKVYWWNNTLEDFTTLYDFGAEEGDEWEIKVGNESITMHVDAVEPYEYQGQTLKLLRVSDANEIFSGEIVCGIGHLTSFFPEKLMSKGCRVEGIRCFWQKGELVFHYGEQDCDEIYDEHHFGIDETDAENGFVIYPNPSHDVLFVKTICTSSLQSEYHITNIIGQTLITDKITSENLKINVSSLSNGMYFITIGNTTTKFLKR